MKKNVLTVMAVLTFVCVQGQDLVVKSSGFTKGDKFVEGGISIASGDNVADYFAITPKVGYMYSENVAFGADLNFSKTTAVNDTKNESYGIGVFTRYYFLKLGAAKNFNAYGEVGLGYNHSKTTPQGEATDVANGIKANIDLGINYFFTDRFAATFILAEILSYNNANPENGVSSSDLVVNINLFNNIFAQPKFGLLYKW